MTLQRTTDAEVIKRVFTHPAIWPRISDDFSPAPSAFTPFISPEVVYILASAGITPVGVFMFVPQNRICWEIHTAILPAFWRKSRQILRALTQFIWTRTPCQRVVTTIVDDNRAAIKLAEDVGMERVGVNPRSTQRGSKLHDLLIYGISRPEVT